MQASRIFPAADSIRNEGHVARVKKRLAESGRAFGQAFRNPRLRRLQIAGTVEITGQWAYSVSLVVFAYGSGGAAAIGVLALVRTIPAALLAPFLAVFADRLPRVAVLVTADLGRAAAVGSAGAIVLAGGPREIVFALAGLASVIAATYAPAERALLPTIARTPEELTSANVTASTIDSIGSFAGPAIGGVLLVTTGEGPVFLMTAAAFVVAALVIASIGRVETHAPAPAAADSEARRGFRHEAGAGFRAIWGDRDLRVLVALYAAQTMVAGALGVLVVVTALDLLEEGKATVGYLNAASGVGGLVGAAAAFALIGRRRLAGDFGLGIVLWGAPLAVIGIWPNTIVALAMLAVLGLGNTLVDVAGLTLLQRAAPPEAMARVFGVLESLLVGTIGLGAIVAPLLVAGLGARVALMITGGFLPVLAALAWRRLAAIDRAAPAPLPELKLLRDIPMFAPLDGPSLERLAAQLLQLEVESGTEVVRQGETGDRFYVVADGELEVLVDGAAVGTLRRGGFFGEIALLRDVPRTATVRAVTPAVVHALEREHFIAAVTSDPPSLLAADAVIAERLGRAG